MGLRSVLFPPALPTLAYQSILELPNAPSPADLVEDKAF